MSHGIGSYITDGRCKWHGKAAQDGYVVYTFDFAEVPFNGNSDVDFMDMTVMTGEKKI